MITDTSTLRAHIRRTELFASLPTDELDELTAVVRQVTLPPDVMLFRENEPGDCLYIVQDGELEVIKELGTDQERQLAICRSGDVIGEMSLVMPGLSRSASVRVRSESSLLSITRSDFETLMQRYPKVALDVIRILSARLRDADNATIRDLREKNLELSRAYADLEAAQQQIVEQETLKRELQHAYEIQQAMLPASLPQVQGVQVGARMAPARMVGGDFYDAIFLPHGDRLIFLVGDVSGKGIPAALFMALSSSLLRADANRGLEPVEVLRSVNRQLVMRQMRSMFVTLFYGDLHLSTRELHYVRAGHELPLMWDEGGDALPAPEGRSQPLGLFADSVLDAQTLVLPAGANLLLYTDGATEAMDASQELFGRARLFAAARSDLSLSPQDLCERLIRTVTDFQPPGAQMDDITFLALRVP